ncbi:hypothetical protein BN946_scf184847.g25 [Trametes cinnabarina]|uniref:Uncharacterized protein n=1 Tax=Pycnoporus cinnabarinus TaxID=5643 RepID=A0A060SJP4_PYCCI|nr:hypothetical protein BN946_scf184847.g25 [Trametes cinnabarina]
MGQGGFLLLYNATQYQWRKTYQHSYQMNNWDFPDTIAPFNGVRIYVEFDESSHPGDDGGDVKYELVGCPAGKAVFWIAIGFRNFYARFPEFAIKRGNQEYPIGTEFGLGWRHDGETVYILTGDYPNMQFLTNVV